MPELDKLLRYLKDKGGSDLHLAAGMEPRVRVRGELEPVPDWGVLSDAQLRDLAKGLRARKLPTFSVVGRSEVEGGMLMTTGGAERDTERLARRVALMIQRIAQGEDPATFEVGFPTSQRLLINMQVAREIGFSPRW